MTINPDRTICPDCKEAAKPKCKHCKKVFYSSRGKEYCLNCRRVLGLLTPVASRNRLSKAMRSMCSNPLEWQSEIKLLQIKYKWGLFNELDTFRVAHIYMYCICDADKYCSLSPMLQAEQMLSELAMLIAEINTKPSEYTKKKPKKKVYKK
jgi:hypothetical protein